MRTYLLWGAVALCLSLQLWSIVFPSVSVASFDEDKVKALFVQQLSKKALSDEMIRHQTALFAKHLQQSLQSYAQKKHLLIFRKEQVLAGERDITNEIIKLMAQKVNHG